MEETETEICTGKCIICPPGLVSGELVWEFCKPVKLDGIKMLEQIIVRCLCVNYTPRLQHCVRLRKSPGKAIKYYASDCRQLMKLHACRACGTVDVKISAQPCQVLFLFTELFNKHRKATFNRLTPNKLAHQQQHSRTRAGFVLTALAQPTYSPRAHVPEGVRQTSFTGELP